MSRCLSYLNVSQRLRKKLAETRASIMALGPLLGAHALGTCEKLHFHRGWILVSRLADSSAYRVV
jgi:hypothetical protein